MVLVELESPYGEPLAKHQGHENLNGSEPSRAHGESLEESLDYYLFSCNANFIFYRVYVFMQCEL